MDMPIAMFCFQFRFRVLVIVLNLISMPEHNSSVEFGQHFDHTFDGHFSVRVFLLRAPTSCLLALHMRSRRAGE